MSLVAFDFCDTRVLGISWPGYRDFPEVNLRFYVRRGEERGVVFIRELVPLRFVAWLAKAIYNEPYRAVPMGSSVNESANAVNIEHRLVDRGRTHVIRAAGAKPANCPGPNSVEHFFKEHHWGFGVSRRGRVLRYEVRHPQWDVFPVREYHVAVDWALLYGPEWEFLSGRAPDSVVLAAGSAVAVYPYGSIAGSAACG